MEKILITGASGFIGQAVSRSLAEAGFEVIALKRGDASTEPPYWDIRSGIIDLGKYRDIDVIIHLAGEPISAGRWDREKKRAIMDSRVNGTTLLTSYLTQLELLPRLFISFSATGFYGNRGDEVITEESPKGTGFLSDVCARWEEATSPVPDAGIRTVILRMGVVLDRNGGMLKRMRIPFKAGFGGRIGDGLQYIPWITLDDVSGIIRHVIATDEMHGVVNVVAPNPVTNREFTHILGSVLHRPSFFVVPAVAAKWVWGEMAQELLLSGARVIPGRLQLSGYRFGNPLLEKALYQLLSSGK